MKKKTENLTNQILKMIESYKKETEAEFYKLVPSYILEKMDPKSKKLCTIQKKLKYIHVRILDCIRLKSVIERLNWIEMTSEMEKFQNPYGLFYTIKEIYYKPDFFNLPIDDQVNILLVEIFNTYSEKGKDYESFLMLCHFKFFNCKPIYSQSKRTKLIELAKLNSDKLPILFSKSINARKFMNQYIIDNNINVQYCIFTQYKGWEVIYLSNEFKDEHFNELINEA